MPEQDNTESPKRIQRRPRRLSVGRDLLDKLLYLWGKDPTEAVGFAALVLARVVAGASV